MTLKEIREGLKNNTISETDFARIAGTSEELPLVDLLALHGVFS